MDGPQTTITDPKTGKKHTFTFDYSYWSHDNRNGNIADQQTVYEDLGNNVLKNAWEGYNSTLFAYGQTGSGKTYSMVGTPTAQGIIPRVCEELFARIESSEDKNTTYRVECSMVEIYKEKVRDLLNPSNNAQLRVREHPKTGPYIEGLETCLVHNYNEISELMEQGASFRTIAKTDMNEHSSRSHTIFEIIFTQETRNATKQGKIVTISKRSKINLVDLAGSERQGKTHNRGIRLEEGSSINKSLTVLGICISNLAKKCTGEKKDIFIPYRDSTLTWLLKESLGGNAKTIMIAAISPADDNYSESLSTLRYADRVKTIKNQARINEDESSKLIRELREEVEKLRQMLSASNQSNDEIEKYKLQLEESQRIIKQLEMSNEEKEKRSLEMQKERQRLLAESGLTFDESGNVFRFSANKTPHFVKLNEVECLIYFFKVGTTYVGSGQECEIIIEGKDIQKEHCSITNNSGTSVILKKLDENAKCFVNGVEVVSEIQLHSGDKVTLGESIFRFMNPSEQIRHRESVEYKRLSNAIITALSKRKENELEMKRQIEEQKSIIEAQEKKISKMIEINKRMDNVIKQLLQRLNIVNNCDEDEKEITFEEFKKNLSKRLKHLGNDESDDESDVDTESSDEPPPPLDMNDIALQDEMNEVKQQIAYLEELLISSKKYLEKLQQRSLNKTS